MMGTNEWVVVRWNIYFGIYYVGPFRDADTAAAWAEDNQGADLNWQVEHLDPTVSLVVSAPGAMPLLQPDPRPDPDTAKWLREVLHGDGLPVWLGNSDDYSPYDHWAARQSSSGKFYLLMVGSDPMRLVGPFPDHRHAYSWGVDYMARTDDEGWQVVWLDDPGRAPVLRQPG